MHKTGHRPHSICIIRQQAASLYRVSPEWCLAILVLFLCKDFLLVEVRATRSSLVKSNHLTAAPPHDFKTLPTDSPESSGYTPGSAAHPSRQTTLTSNHFGQAACAKSDTEEHEI